MNEVIYNAADAAIHNKMTKEQFIEAFKNGNTFYCFDEIELTRFVENIVAHCSESVRQVLRDESSNLTYDDAYMIQQNIMNFFGIKS